MKFSRLLIITLLPAAALLLASGCESYEHDTTGLYAKNNQGVNLLGFVDTSPQSYQKVGATTLPVHSDELTKRKNVSGDNVSILWGAITYADY